MRQKRGKRILTLLAAAQIAISLLFGGCGAGRAAWEAVGRRAEVLPPEAKEAPSISADRFAYEQLDGQTQGVYDQILQCILKHEEKTTVSTMDKDVLERAFSCVMMDYGGLFWISGYQYNTYMAFDQIVGLEFEPHYVYSEKEREDLQAQVDAAVEEWMAGISINDSDYDKARYVFETLIGRVDYRADSPDNQNILSVFLHGETVCQGYADATQYLLQDLGITCAVVTGEADGSNHAWNLVKLDGNYYYTDATWGNSRYRSEDSGENKHINYAYLNTTLADIQKTHTADVPVELPESETDEDTYFVKEGLYFTAFDPAAIGGCIQGAWRNGDGRISVKLSGEDIHKETLDYFVTRQKIFSYCPGLGSISYLDEESLGVITFIFP